MPQRQTDGLTTYHFEDLAVPGLVHAVFTRLGGVSREPFASLNISEKVGDEEAAVAENRARIYAHLGLSAEQVAMTGQVHGNRVLRLTAADAGRAFPNTDGFVTDAPGVALFLRFADCQPILLYDPEHHALGLVHAGWRGAAQAIARRAVEAMQEAFDTRPEALLAGLGPAIGPCCYTVGQDVAAAMGYALPDWSRAMQLLQDDVWRFDLSAANAQLLTAAGVRHIERADLCTACHKEIFFSHRGDEGRTGRFAIVAFLQERAQKRGAVPSPPGGDTRQRRYASGGVRGAVFGKKSQGVKAPHAEPDAEGRREPESLHPPGFPEFGKIQGADQ